MAGAIMKAEWLSDARKIPDEVMNYLPRIAVRAVEKITNSPELNPDEKVWSELKTRQLGKQPIKNKTDLKKQIRSILKSLQHKAEKVRVFF